MAEISAIRNYLYQKYRTLFAEFGCKKLSVQTSNMID